MKTFILLFFVTSGLFSQSWIPDLGNGMYKNPIIFSDYSDPDLIRVGDDFYMVSSSFNCMPGIPVLHSKDLVNWSIIGHVYNRLPLEKYDKPAYGEGCWAPSIRFHDNIYYVYFCTPHEGLFVATAAHPAGPWKLEHIVNVEMWEDPSPFWDDDGQAYLVRSKLRADILYLHKMSPDGKKILDNGTIVYEDTTRQPTIEGPKLLKKDGYYYIFSPAGGVRKGWQTVLRSKNIYGPYEDKVVLHTGNTDINGPHQGGIVELKSGEWWFCHFQDKGVYGRIVHLEPVQWNYGWPLIGHDINNDGVGEPVIQWKKPDIGKTFPIEVPQTSDEFNGPGPGLQWQWQANPQEKWYSMNKGHLRLYAVKNISQNGNLYFVPNLILQKFPAPSFSVITKIEFDPDLINEKSGLVIMGRKWAFVALSKTERGLTAGMYKGKYSRENDATETIETQTLNTSLCYLKVTVQQPGHCRFSYSRDGKNFIEIGEPFTAVPGVWIGAKVGLFNINPNMQESSGYADFDWFRFTE